MKATGTVSAVLLIAVSTVLSSTAQLIFRFVMQHYELFTTGTAPRAALLSSFSAADGALLLAGIALYGISMLAWIFVLSRFDVSFAYPLMSISYLLVFVGAVTLPYFHEALTLSKLVAMVLVVAGVAILSFEENRSVATAPGGHGAHR